MRQVVVGFWGCIWKLPVHLEESGRCEQLAIDLEVMVTVRWMPLQFIWFKVKEQCLCWIRNLLLDDWDKGTMIKTINCIRFNSRVVWLTVKWCWSHFHPLCSSNHSKISSSDYLCPSCLLMVPHNVYRTSADEKPGSQMISSSCLKLSFNFWGPWFQNQFLRHMELLLG